MMPFYDQWLWPLVFEWLNCIDCLAMVYAEPRLGLTQASFVHKKMMRKINEALKHYNVDPLWIRELLIAQKAFISGSFLLFVLYEDHNWLPWDIDIINQFQRNDLLIYNVIETLGRQTTDPKEVGKYDIDVSYMAKPCIESEDPENMEQSAQTKRVFKRKREQVAVVARRTQRTYAFVDTCLEKSDDPTVIYAYEQNEQTADSRRQYPLGLPIVSRTFFFFRDSYSPVFNLIHVIPPCTPTHYVKDFFDLDFCKVTYDGKKVQISDVESLFTKTATVHWDAYKALHGRWIQCPHLPYSENCNYDTEQARDAWLYSRLIDRQIKYRQRGFHVHLHMGSQAGTIPYFPPPDTCYSAAEF